MKKIIYISIIAIFTASLTSCGSVSNVTNTNKEIAGYTLKNKKEQMQQKILNKKSKTAIATP